MAARTSPVRGLISTVEGLRSRAEKAEAARDALAAALADIANPMKALWEKAEREDALLGAYAITLCKNVAWLQEKAVKALDTHAPGWRSR